MPADSGLVNVYKVSLYLQSLQMNRQTTAVNPARIEIAQNNWGMIFFGMAICVQAVKQCFRYLVTLLRARVYMYGYTIETEALFHCLDANCHSEKYYAPIVLCNLYSRGIYD